MQRQHCETQTDAYWGVISRSTQTGWMCYAGSAPRHMLSTKTPRKYTPAAYGRYKRGVGTQTRVPRRSMCTQTPKAGIYVPEVPTLQLIKQDNSNQPATSTQAQDEARDSRPNNVEESGWEILNHPETNVNNDDGGEIVAVTTAPTIFLSDSDDDEIASLTTVQNLTEEKVVFKVPAVPERTRPATPGASLEPLFIAREVARASQPIEQKQVDLLTPPTTPVADRDDDWEMVPTPETATKTTDPDSWVFVDPPEANSRLTSPGSQPLSPTPPEADDAAEVQQELQDILQPVLNLEMSADASAELLRITEDLLDAFSE